MDWAATWLTLWSLWLLASPSKDDRFVGFVMNGTAAVVWALWAIRDVPNPWSLVLVNAVIFVLDVRGALKQQP